MADLTGGVPAQDATTGRGLITAADLTSGFSASQTLAAGPTRSDRAGSGNAEKIITERAGGAAAGWGA